MYNIVTTFGFLASVGIVNSSNFFVIIIAVIVAFFLLGLILGSNFNPRKRTSKDNKKIVNEEIKETPPPANTMGQDNQINDTMKENGFNTNQRQRNPGYRYYNNYW